MKISLFVHRPAAICIAVLSATSFGVPFIAYAQGPAPAILEKGKACQSLDVKSKKCRQEKDLLGTRHADGHVRMRMVQCHVYSPPYLFKGAQPVITQAPAALTYDQSFSVATDRDGMTSAMLVAASATTHGNDMHQRAIKLKVTPLTNGRSAQIPSSCALVPPGNYMLFVLDTVGIPSVARFVRIS